MEKRNMVIGYIITELLEHFPDSYMNIRPTDADWAKKKPDGVAIEVYGSDDSKERGSFLWELEGDLSKQGLSTDDFHILILERGGMGNERDK